MTVVMELGFWGEDLNGWLQSPYMVICLYDTKLQIIHQYGFSLWEPLLYNGGLMVLGCSCSGEALATPEPLISSPICSSKANEVLWCV
jgi:hypothetical protein